MLGGLGSKMGGSGCAHLVDQGADALEAGLVVGLAEVDGAADLRVHFRAAEFFGGGFLSDGGLDERGTGEKKAAAFGHQDVSHITGR